MPYTQKEIEANYQRMFGLSIARMAELYGPRKMGICVEVGMFGTEFTRYAICMLSDAQMLIERGAQEEARVLLNRAKYVLDKGCELATEISDARTAEFNKMRESRDHSRQRADHLQETLNRVDPLQ